MLGALYPILFIPVVVPKAGGAGLRLEKTLGGACDFALRKGWVGFHFFNGRYVPALPEQPA